MKVVWSPLAIQRVLESAEYIARDKPDAAVRWAESTFDATDRLRNLPESGRIVPELRRPEVHELLHGAYRIIYRIDDERILVLSVRHGSRRLDARELDAREGSTEDRPAE